METNEKTEQQSITGTITMRNFALRGDRANEIDSILAKASDIPQDAFITLLAELRQLCDMRKISFHNAIVQSGREVIARQVLGDTTYDIAISHGALGDSATAVSDGQTTLVNEVARKAVASTNRSTDSAIVDFYYSKADTNGTYEEFGVFMDGTATADSGQMFNRALTGGWSKSSSEAMTVSLQIDFNDA